MLPPVIKPAASTYIYVCIYHVTCDMSHRILIVPVGLEICGGSVDI